MRIGLINPDRASDKLSIAYAMAQGYGITLDGDGSAEVVNGGGAVYHIHEWQCDCPDALSRRGGSYERADGTRICKHVAWLSQLYPCPNCGGTMVEHQMDQGDGIKFFACHTCRSLKAAGLVLVERRKARREAQEAHSATIPEDHPETRPAFRWDAETAQAAAEDTAGQASLMAYAY